jgi:hypothetical protein
MTRSSSLTAERYAQGVKLRREIARQNHADLLGAADRDPVAILAAGDRTRLPNLIPVRYQRMLANAFAVLRGSAAVMAQDLRHPGVWRLPPDELRSFCHAGGKHSVRHR